MSNLRRVLFLTVMPSPYQRQLFLALAERSGWTIEVAYYTASVRDREWDRAELAAFERVLPGRTLHFLGPSAHLNLAVIKLLRQRDYDLVVVSDYSAPTAQLAMWYLTAAKRKWVYWGESPGMRQGLMRGLLRAVLMLPIRLGAASICAIGDVAVERYKQNLGLKKKIYNIPYFCDLRPFRGQHKARSDRFIILFCGQFIERKGLDLLIDAFLGLADEIPTLDLLLVGGTESSPFLRAVPKHLKDRVSVAGFVQSCELPLVYQAADVFVLPSRYDGWGVVVNEALGAGLPLIVSDAVGAARDLVEHGRNGFVFKCGDARQLAERIRQLATSANLTARFAEESRKRAEKFGISEGVDRWKSVFEQLVRG